MSNSSQRTRPVGWVLWEELLEEVILHITPLCSLFIPYGFKGQAHVSIYRTSENCKSLVLQDRCNIERYNNFGEIWSLFHKKAIVIYRFYITLNPSQKWAKTQSKVFEWPPNSNLTCMLWCFIVRKKIRKVNKYRRFVKKRFWHFDKG